MLKTVEPVDVPIRQVVAGSLTMLAADGSGVGYDRRFTPAEGVLRTQWTIAGATADLDPDRLHGASQGRHITARIEVASGDAVEIDPGTLVLEAGEAVIPAAARWAVVYHDGDSNPELEAVFDRQAVIDATRGSTGTIPVTLRWRYRDGTHGNALTLLTRT